MLTICNYYYHTQLILLKCSNIVGSLFYNKQYLEATVAVKWYYKDKTGLPFSKSLLNKLKHILSNFVTYLKSQSTLYEYEIPFMRLFYLFFVV